jgi:hypothetical protein
MQSCYFTVPFHSLIDSIVTALALLKENEIKIEIQASILSTQCIIYKMICFLKDGRADTEKDMFQEKELKIRVTCMPLYRWFLVMPSILYDHWNLLHNSHSEYISILIRSIQLESFTLLSL